MARITSKQAKEMNEAYAKVHRNLQEGLLDNIPSRSSQTRRRNMAGKEDLNTKTLGNNNQSSNNNQQSNTRPGFSSGTQQRIDALKNSANKAGVKPNEGPVTVERGKRVDNQSSSAPNGSGGRRTGIDGPELMNKLKNPSGDNVQSSSGNQPSGNQSTPGVNRSQTVVKDGNKTTTTTKTSADDSTPEGAAAVQDAKAAFKAKREARAGGNTGSGNAGSGETPPSTGGGGKKPGLLGRLGSLAGKAVGSARNVASNVKQGAQAAASNVKQGAQSAANTARNAASGIKQVATSAASNIKKGAESVAGGAKRVAGGVADAATGNMTDFDKRGGKPTGAARVVAGGIDKLTGDRTDLDKRGVTPLNAGQRAQQQQQQKPAPQQQQQKPAPQAQAKPAPQAQAKPALSNNSPAAKAGIPLAQRQAAADKNAAFQAARKSGNMKQYRKDNPKLSGADRAKAMARERIAAKKAAAAKPAPTAPINSSYDFFDDTVQFLVSEGHAKDKSEAMSIKSESEFIDAFNQELNG